MAVLAKLKARASEVKGEVWALFFAARHPRKSLSQSDADTKHREPAANIAAVI